MDYDRAGRTTGTAYVTYANYRDARDAVREFNGQNARGQPIRLTIIPNGPHRRAAGKSLADRITGGLDDRSNRERKRSRSRSPDNRRVALERTPEGIDRYVPNGRSRSPRRRGPPRTEGSDRRRDNPAGGSRRTGGNSRRVDHGRPAAGGRSKPSKDELDKDM
jgi:THO complex subunit 4